jgi:hypothetical protein
MMYRFVFIVMAMTIACGCALAQDTSDAHYDSLLWARSNPKDRALHQAINRHDLIAVRQLLSEGANPNALDRDGHPLLMSATTDDENAAIIQLLIDSGADVNAQRGWALTWAMGKQDNPKNVAILLKAGAKVNAREGDSSTILMSAALDGHADIIQLLLSAGADVNARSEDGRTAIDYAEKPAIRDLLIKAGANPNGHLAPVVARLDKETFPHTLKEFDRDVSNALCDIDKYWELTRTGYNESINDSLELANAYLEMYLEKNLAKIPITLTARIPESLGINVVTSSDRKLRFWSWDTHMGGSMPQIQELAEYVTQNGVEIIDPQVRNDPNQDSWIDKIRTVHTNSGQTIYLAISGWQGDGMHVGEQVNAYAIKDSKLTDIPFFKAKKGLLSSISYYSATGRRNRFKFHDDGKTFLVPLARYASAEAKKNDEVTMTSRSLRYEFDGNYYVYRGVSN